MVVLFGSVEDAATRARIWRNVPVLRESAVNHRPSAGVLHATAKWVGASGGAAQVLLAGGNIYAYHWTYIGKRVLKKLGLR
jgi:hypothetical protein